MNDPFLMLRASFRYCGINIVMGIYNSLPSRVLDSMFKYWSEFAPEVSNVIICADSHPYLSVDQYGYLPCSHCMPCVHLSQS